MKRLSLALAALLLTACSPGDKQIAEQVENTQATGDEITEQAINAGQSELLKPGNYQQGLTATVLTDQCDTDLDDATTVFHQLEALKPPYTSESILKPLDQLFIQIDNASSMVYLLSNVHPDSDLQKAGDTCVQEFSKLLTDIGLSKQLYDKLKQVEASDADTETQRFLTKILNDFKRSGVDKNDKERAEVRKLNEKIVALGQEFSTNIREDVRSIQLKSVDQLEGLPEDYIAQHSANDDGIITITTDYPDLFPVLRYAKNDATRFKIYQQYLNRGYPENDEVLKNIVTERHKLATLLGYPSYASYATEEMMVGNPAVVKEFIEKISTMVKNRADKDYSELLKALQKIDSSTTSVGNWQKSFLEETVRREKYSVDTKVIRQYFQYKKVKQGIFTLIEDLFSVSIKPWNTAVWDEKVEAFEIWENGKVIGQFYLDMHPREGKYKHAAQFGVQSGVAGQQLPVAALVCNFPGGDDSSGLMEHSQVETFLHEFGHLIHSIFGGQQQWGSFSGVATERDFVEAPSQMLEEWIWNYDTLKAFATNEKGEVIPRDLVEKMRTARDFARGTHIRNQMFYAALSLAIYQTAPEELDIKSTMIKLQGKYSPFAYIDDTHFYASFGHLYGYSAAYYTYMWSEVIAADILQAFKKGGMRNQALAKRYRDTVLAPGGSKDAADLVSDFLGRPFNFDAFVERLNQPHSAQ